MTNEDNYNAPNRSIADWIAEGYTKPYATALFAQANKRMTYLQTRNEKQAIIYTNLKMTIMTNEDNYNAPNRSIADWIAEGYTKPYATALFAQANKREKRNTQL